MNGLRHLVWVLLACSCGRTALVDFGSDGGLPPGGAGCDVLTVPDPDTGLRERWNLAVDSVQPLTRNFTWSNPKDFPHPTYRFGDMTAYTEFSTVLVAFWRAEDNLDFVRCNDLFDRTYLSGPRVQTQRTVQLRAVTRQMAGEPLVAAERQAELRVICATIGC